MLDKTRSKFGRKRDTGKPKGRQLDDAALVEIRELLGDRERRPDLLIEFLHLIQDSQNCLPAAHLVAGCGKYHSGGRRLGKFKKHGLRYRADPRGKVVVGSYRIFCRIFLQFPTYEFFADRLKSPRRYQLRRYEGANIFDLPVHLFRPWADSINASMRAASLAESEGE